MKQIWRITFEDGSIEDLTIFDFYDVCKKINRWTSRKLQNVVSVVMIGDSMLRCEKEPGCIYPLAVTHELCQRAERQG